MSEYRLIMGGVIALCALAVGCSVWPELDRIATITFTTLAIAGGLAVMGGVVWFLHAVFTDLPDDDYPADQQTEFPSRPGVPR